MSSPVKQVCDERPKYEAAYHCLDPWTAVKRRVAQYTGHGESLFMVQTAAFDDYKGLQFSKQFVDSQLGYYKEHFPEDLKKAHELGKRLVEEANAKTQA